MNTTLKNLLWMKAKTRILYLIVMGALFLLGSCDDRDQYFLESIISPEASFAKDSIVTSITDSLKHSIKSSGQYQKEIFFDPLNFNIKDLRVMASAATLGVFSINGQKIDPGKVNLGLITDSLKGKIVLRFVPAPEATGVQDFDLTFIDRFKKEANLTFRIVLFKNISPVAMVSATRVGAIQALEYQIDGSQSFDRDAKFGGRVIRWNYTIEGNTKNGSFIQKLEGLSTPKIGYIFPEEGRYSITVTVMDNNGTLSEAQKVEVDVTAQ